MNEFFAAWKRHTAYESLVKCCVGLSLMTHAAVAVGQNPYPSQYPQNPVQTNGYYSSPAPAALPPGPSGQPFPGQGFASQTTQQASLEPVFVKRHNFDIPLNVSARGSNPPAEVHLFVSRDSGRSWEFYSRELPSAGRFAFSAPSDGEYWFAVRPSHGAQGITAVPSASLAPSLRVAVDTSQPIVEMKSAADAAGVVNVQFSVADNAPNRSGIQIYYRTDTPDAEWLALDTNRIQWLSSGNSQLDGQIGFDPHVDWRRISLHFVATDQAGNQTTSQKIVERPRVAGTPALLASVTAPNALAPPVSPIGSPPEAIPAANNNFVAPQNNLTNADTGYAVVSPQPSSPPGYYSQPSNPTRYQTTQQKALAYRGMVGQPTVSTDPAAQPTSEMTQPDASPAIDTPANSSPAISTPSPPHPSSAFRAIQAETLPTPTQRNPIAPPVAPGIGTVEAKPHVPNTADTTAENVTNLVRNAGSPRSSEIGMQPTDAVVPDQSSAAKLPVSENEINYSRQAEFSLDYEFDSLGSRGINKVELWGTRDAGKTWDYWGSDPDNSPPFDVSVSGQGLYGFRIVVIDSQNLTSPTPQGGDEPEIYVLVDKTAPIVDLVSASYGEGVEAGSLIIEYTYNDDNPISRPISLSFGETSSGPWTTIATGLENTGRYVWPIDPRLPKTLYLRAEGTDRAGNTGVEVNPNPVSLRGLAPTARIKGFQPLASDR